MTVIDWLLDSDPSVRWQVMRDLTDAPAQEVAAERARVATEGAGARLLALQATDGRWGGAAWNRGWDSTMHVLTLLREMGLDPASAEVQNLFRTLIQRHIAITSTLAAFEQSVHGRLPLLRKCVDPLLPNHTPASGRVRKD